MRGLLYCHFNVSQYTVYCINRPAERKDYGVAYPFYTHNPEWKRDMDEIEAGYQKILKKIDTLKEKKDTFSGEILKNDAALLSRMAESTTEIIGKVGLNMLERGKIDSKGELYDTLFTQKKLIILGKTDPVEYRPDDTDKKVDDQFCTLSEDGKFYEIMYSSDGFLVDSYQNEITPREALDIYGYDILFMLYRAMHDYLQGQESLVEALGITIEYLFPEQSVEKK